VVLALTVEIHRAEVVSWEGNGSTFTILQVDEYWTDFINGVQCLIAGVGEDAQ